MIGRLALLCWFALATPASAVVTDAVDETIRQAIGLGQASWIPHYLGAFHPYLCELILEDDELVQQIELGEQESSLQLLGNVINLEVATAELHPDYPREKLFGLYYVAAHYHRLETQYHEKHLQLRQRVSRLLLKPSVLNGIISAAYGEVVDWKYLRTSVYPQLSEKARAEFLIPLLLSEVLPSSGIHELMVDQLLGISASTPDHQAVWLEVLEKSLQTQNDSVLSWRTRRSIFLSLHLNSFVGLLPPQSYFAAKLEFYSALDQHFQGYEVFGNPTHSHAVDDLSMREFLMIRGHQDLALRYLQALAKLPADRIAMDLDEPAFSTFLANVNWAAVIASNPELIAQVVRPLLNSLSLRSTLRLKDGRYLMAWGAMLEVFLASQKNMKALEADLAFVGQLDHYDHYSHSFSYAEGLKGNPRFTLLDLDRLQHKLDFAFPAWRSVRSDFIPPTEERLMIDGQGSPASGQSNCDQIFGMSNLS